MTVVNPKSISGINSITTGSGSDDILTIHNNNGTERLRIDSTGTTKITTGIVTTLTATSSAKVGSGVTLSPDGDIFATGVCTATSFVGSGANLTGISQVGGATGVDFNDNVKARFGTGNDLEIYHNASHSIIHDNGTGDLKIIGDDVIIQADNDDTMAKFIEDGAVELYHNGTKKIETSSNGVTISGQAQIDGNSYPYSDNNSDLGLSSNRWQDLFLSGNIYLGGTGSANALDDYEEGTFTPEFNSGSSASACYAGGVSYSSQVGVYRKVGNVVHFIIKIQVSSGTLKSGVLQINNLPFNSGDFSSYSAAGGAFYGYTTGYFSDTANLPTIFVSPGAATMQFFNTAGNNFAGTHLAQAAGRLDINGHYFTS